MSFKFAVIKYAAKPVRGPRATCVWTGDTEREAVAWAETAGAETADNFYVVEVVAQLARVMQVTRPEKRDREPFCGVAWVGKDDGKTRTTLDSGRPDDGRMCWGCGMYPDDHPNEIGCAEWHRRSTP